MLPTFRCLIRFTMTATSSPPEQFSCPSCNANLEFDPATNSLVCAYCGTSQVIQHTFLGAPAEQKFDDFWDEQHTQLAALSTTAMEVNCPGCHADIAFEPPDVAGRCPFCNTSIVAQPHTANPVITPNGIIPFQFGRKDAQQKIRQWLGNLWFAPTGLKKLAQDQGIQGVYLPFWTYDCKTFNQYTGKRGTYYYVTVTYTDKDSNGRTVTRTRQERRTRWKSVSGSVSHFCDDVLVAATHAVSKSQLEKLKPWDLQKLVPYKSSYLAGFKAQRYEANLKQGFEIAKDEGIKAAIYVAVQRDIGGDTQQVLSVQTTYDDVTFKHILLPIWIASYRFKNKTYQVIVNGQTGKLLGDRPWSILKIVGSAVAAVIIATIGQCMGAVNEVEYSPDPSYPPPTPTDTYPSSLTSPPTAPPQATSSDITFQQAINLAGQAATQTQSAQSSQEWQAVANLWIQSIEMLKQVPPASSNYNTAQQKIQEYQINLNYARQRI